MSIARQFASIAPAPVAEPAKPDAVRRLAVSNSKPTVPRPQAKTDSVRSSPEAWRTYHRDLMRRRRDQAALALMDRDAVEQRAKLADPARAALAKATQSAASNAL